MDVVNVLNREFERRRKKNPAYSMRSYARALDVSPGALSEILAKKRSLTTRVASRMVENLELAPSIKSKLLRSIETRGIESSSPAMRLKDDEFRLIKDWWHYGALSAMATTRKFRRPNDIARYLGISSVEATEALERLDRLGLAKETESGWKPTYQVLRSTEDTPSHALRQHHKQIMKLAVDRLQDTPTEKREYSATMLAIKPNCLEKAKKLIRDFRDEFESCLEKEEQGSEVYNLAIQFFPVSRQGGEG